MQYLLKKIFQCTHQKYFRGHFHKNIHIAVRTIVSSGNRAEY